MPILIPLAPEFVEAQHAGFRSKANLSVLPHTLLLHPRGYPSHGADIEPVYASAISGTLSRRIVSLGVIVYEDDTGRLARAEPRALVEDDPHQNISDLLSIYRLFARNFEDTDARRDSASLIALFLELYWMREEITLRTLLASAPAP